MRGLVVDSPITVLYTLQRFYMVGATIYNAQGIIYLSAKVKVCGTEFAQTPCRQTTVKIKSGMG